LPASKAPISSGGPEQYKHTFLEMEQKFLWFSQLAGERVAYTTVSSKTKLLEY
jgi:hypothetical protein